MSAASASTPAVSRTIVQSVSPTPWCQSAASKWYDTAVALTLEVTYESAAGLRRDWDTQLKVGGLFAAVSAEEPLEPLAALTLLLVVDGAAPISAPARLTVANPDSL